MEMDALAIREAASQFSDWYPSPFTCTVLESLCSATPFQCTQLLQFCCYFKNKNFIYNKHILFMSSKLFTS